MKFDERLMNFVRKDIDNGLIPMLLGEPGIGKSSWLINLANLMHTKCFVLACNQLADKADLTGARLVPIYKPILDANGNPTGEQEIVDYKQMFYPHAVIHDAIEYAEQNPRETPILFLDELNRTTPDVTSEALSIPTLRSIGSKSLPDNLRVVIAGNDKGNVTSLDEASVSRFVLYRVTPDVNTFLSLDDNLNPFIKATLQKHPECIFCKSANVYVQQKDDDDDKDNQEELSIEDILEDGDDMAQITTPRTISNLSNWLNGFSNQELIDALADTYIVDGEQTSLLQEAIEGHVGRTNFATYLIAEIATNIMTTNNQSATATVGKPNVYDTMKNCADMTSLNDLIATMSENDKSGCLLYALYEKADNKRIIQALAPEVDKLMNNDMKTLMSLSASDKLDAENIQTLLTTKSGIATRLSVILETE